MIFKIFKNPLSLFSFSFSLFAFLFVFVSSAFASDFSLKTTTTYEPTVDSSAKVSVHYQLTNLTSKSYATSYKVVVKDPYISNLVVKEGQAELPITKNALPGAVELTFVFKNPAIGEGATKSWTITYEANNVVQKNGDLIQINLAPAAIDSNQSSYSINLLMPQGKAQPIEFKPSPKTRENGIYSWTNKELQGSGIYALFTTKADPKDHAVYSFKTIYHLKNTSDKSAQIEVPIPPDTGYQKVQIDSIKPAPLNVHADNDGNWLASFFVGKNSELTAEVNGYVAIFSTPAVVPFTTPKDNSVYKKAQQFWESDSAVIKNESLKYDSVQSIYKGVIEILKNRPSTTDQTRQGAQFTLISDNPIASQHYTDLFISLARARNTPAREIIGTTIGAKNSSLHSWPEYFDSQTKRWQMVDPALEVATGGIDFFSSFDKSHFAFLIRGESSVTPYLSVDPKNQNLFQFALTPINDEANIYSVPKLDIKINFPKTITSGFGNTGKIIVSNPGPSAHPITPVEIKSDTLVIKKAEMILPALPPYANEEINVEFSTKSVFSDSDDIISIVGADKTYTANIKSIPVYKSLPFQILGVAITLITIAFIAKTSRRLSNERQAG